MAKITIIKHKKEDLQREFMKWSRERILDQTYEVAPNDKKELFQILQAFSSEIDIVKAIEESSYFITDDGLHHIASMMLEDFIKEDTHYIILDKVEVFDQDSILVVLTD
jgi:hypothetical protein